MHFSAPDPPRRAAEPPCPPTVQAAAPRTVTLAGLLAPFLAGMPALCTASRAGPARVSNPPPYSAKTPHLTTLPTTRGPITLTPLIFTVPVRT